MRTGCGEAVSEAAGIEETVLVPVMLGPGVLEAVRPAEIDPADVEDLKLEVVLDALVLELEANEVVPGATKTMLGIEVCTTSVAVIVACVLGNALGCPLHILYAALTTESTNISTSSQYMDPCKTHPSQSSPYRTRY